MRVSIPMSWFFAALAAVTLSTAAVQAQVKAAVQVPAKVAAESDPRADLVADLGLAAQLAAFGNGDLNELSGLPKDFRSPEALVAAGTIMLRAHKLTGGQQVDANAEVMEDGKAVPAAGKASTLLDEAKALYDTARAQAEGKQLADLEKQIKVEMDKLNKEERPAVGGPRVISRTIKSGKKHNINIAFEPNSPATVAMQGTGTTQFEVVGPRGNVLWHSKGAWGVYNWNTGTGRNDKDITIRVINRGGPDVAYTIRTN